MKRLLLLIFLTFPVIGNGADNYIKGNELLIRCTEVINEVEGQGRGDHYEAGFCLGYVLAIIHSSYSYRNEKGEHYFCPPTNITSGQAVRILVKFLRDHPEQLHESGLVLTIAALHKAFPCHTQ